MTDLERPEPEKRDVVYTLIKAVIAGVPVIGGAATELISMVALPLEKRRNQWLDDIAKRLKSLEGVVDEFRIEDLSQNETFITVVMHATQVAIRNHQQEKLEALRNAVLNAAMPEALEDDRQLMFLNFIDELTSWHLRVLHFFDDPKIWGSQHNISYPKWNSGGPDTLLEFTFEELRGQRDFYDQVVRDLHYRGLMNIDSLHITMTGQGMFASRTTEMAKGFLAFISSPIPE
ncbi:MAG: hypothetical protein F4Y39_01425 [Gemmatimonadetes bacterium]|nr:hypothetical protein [Gemmatimonadota bacterium]MYK51642.1 hypothetical protein [Gemmatimonadota bacterium]